MRPVLTLALAEGIVLAQPSEGPPLTLRSPVQAADRLLLLLRRRRGPRPPRV